MSNVAGSVEGSVDLIVHAEGERDDNDDLSVPRVESSPVEVDKMGEYVASLHSHNNAGFILQYQV